MNVIIIKLFLQTLLKIIENSKKVLFMIIRSIRFTSLERKANKCFICLLVQITIIKPLNIHTNNAFSQDNCIFLQDAWEEWQCFCCSVTTEKGWTRRWKGGSRGRGICKVHVCALSHVWLIVTPRTVACQALLSVEFPRPEYWSGLSFPPPGDRPDSGTEAVSPALASGFFTSEPSSSLSFKHGSNNLLSLCRHSTHKPCAIRTATKENEAYLVSSTRAKKNLQLTYNGINQAEFQGKLQQFH